MTDRISFLCPWSPVTQEKGRHKRLGKPHSLPPPPSLLNVKESAFLTCVSAQTQKQRGECCSIQKKKTQGSFSIKLLTLKRDIAVIDSLLMVWGGILALCAVRMWVFNRTLKIKTNCGKQLCIYLWVELQEQYFSNYISSVFPGVSEKIILYYLKYFTGSVVKQY